MIRFRYAAIVPALFAVLPFAVSAQGAQDSYAAAPPASVSDTSGKTTVPITLQGVHIYLDATINGKPARFVLDSGAGANILTPEAAQRLGLTLDLGEGRATGAQTVTTRHTTVDRLQIGNATLSRESVYVVALPAELGCDGLLGYSVLSRFVTTVDYENNTLTLALPRNAERPKGPNVTALPLSFSDNLPLIPGTLDGIKGKFRLDTGAGDALTLFPAFVDRYKIRARYPKRLETVTGKGVGGLLYGELVKINAFTLGTGKNAAEVKNVPVEISRRGQGAFSEDDESGNIGGYILRRFTVTFDYPAKRVYFKPNKEIADPFTQNRSGLSVSLENGRQQVVAVIAGSPGAEAGVRVGDTLLAVDGVGVDKLSPSQIREAFRRGVGTKIELLVRAENAEPRKANLTLRDLL